MLFLGCLMVLSVSVDYVGGATDGDIRIKNILQSMRDALQLVRQKRMTPRDYHALLQNRTEELHSLHYKLWMLDIRRYAFELCTRMAKYAAKDQTTNLHVVYIYVSE